MRTANISLRGRQHYVCPRLLLYNNAKKLIYFYADKVITAQVYIITDVFLRKMIIKHGIHNTRTKQPPTSN